MNHLATNELTNLVLLLIKQGYGHLLDSAKDPSVALLQAVLLECADHGTSVPEVIRCTMFVMETQCNVCLVADDFERLHAYLHRVAASFMRQPSGVRNSEHEHSEELVTLQ